MSERMTMAEDPLVFLVRVRLALSMDGHFLRKFNAPSVDNDILRILTICDDREPIDDQVRHLI